MICMPSYHEAKYRKRLNNSDGDNNGNSWNCGAEGETDDPQIEGLRLGGMVKCMCNLNVQQGTRHVFMRR